MTLPFNALPYRARATPAHHASNLDSSPGSCPAAVALLILVPPLDGFRCTTFTGPRVRQRYAGCFLL